MSSRSTMTHLIEQLRHLTQTTPADWEVGTVAYWDALRLQQVLDRHRIDLHRLPLQALPKHTGGGSLEYWDYQSEWGNLEATQGGTARFVVEDGKGTDKGTATYTVDYLRGLITFTTNQRGTAYYLTGRAFDLHGAAADVWRAKAAHYAATGFDFSTDNMKINRSQVVANCERMAAHHEAQMRPRITTMIRGDEVP